MKSLEEQIADKCIHFNGITNQECKIGINYRDTFGPVLAGVFPCIKGGTASCDKCHYPSPEEIKEKVQRMVGASSLSLKAYVAVKNHIQKAKDESRPTPMKGTIDCPNGDHKLQFAMAITNGHLRIACKECQISMME
jgi:hypothetical protein